VGTASIVILACSICPRAISLHTSRCFQRFSCDLRNGGTEIPGDPVVGFCTEEAWGEKGMIERLPAGGEATNHGDISTTVSNDSLKPASHRDLSSSR
jgi:hypothetical protein